MDEQITGVVWVDPENYPRFSEVCGGDYPPSYIEFLQLVGPQILALEKLGNRIEKVVVDPDEMERWCLRNHGKVDPEARAAFAMFKLRSKYGKGAEAIN